LILAGGGDIAPTAYDGEPHETIYAVSEERDHFEFALVRAALARRDTPLLCICRGMQVLNVACGGSLHAHVPDRFGARVAHRLPPRLRSQHAVRIDPKSRLADLVGITEPEVCSWHHQAIDRLGDGLRPVAWADDGVIEAVEQTQHPWCIGVQWHPEMQLGDANQQRLFAGLVAAITELRD
jgi:putative glutamine amidotransferase